MSVNERSHPSRGPVIDPAALVTRALTEVCFGKSDGEPLEATIDRYFAPEYHQRTDGLEANRAEFIRHIRALRSTITQGKVEVLEAIMQGRRIADRHRVTITRRDGAVSQIEVYLFGELTDDGRFRRVDEVSRVIYGAEDDADLARVR